MFNGDLRRCKVRDDAGRTASRSRHMLSGTWHFRVSLIRRERMDGNNNNTLRDSLTLQLSPHLNRVG